MNILPQVVELVRKNLKNLVRAKAGSLVVILGPLLVIFLAGIAFDNSNIYKVKIGTYVPGANDITTAFLDQLRGEFKVIEYASQEECIDSIRQTDVNTCMVFSSNFTIGKPPANEITFHVDYSRINLVWTILQVMTERVSEKTLQASKNLTSILLDTLEYTHQRINDQREVVIALTTQNDLLSKNTQQLMAELSDIDLTFDESAVPIEDLINSKTQVKQWMDSVLSVADKSLSKSTSFIDAANALVKSSSAGNQVKDQLLANFQKSVDEIAKVKENLAETKNLTAQSFAEFSKDLDAVAQQLSNTKSRLQEADTSRHFSLRVLDAISNLLDKSLLSLVEVQAAMNDIDNKITAIEIKDPAAVSQPIVTSIKPLVQQKTYLNYLFPVLIVLVIMFTALLITPTLILLDKHSPASFRTYMTPVADASYIISNFITAFILLFLQTIIILAIASVFFSGQIISNVPKALLLLLVINSLFILIGMILGYIFNNEETATLAAVSLGAIFLFISDVIIPIESMPEAFSYIAGFNPYVLGSSLLRRSLLFDSSFISMMGDIAILLGYIVAASLLASGIYIAMRRYSLQRLGKSLGPVFTKVKFKK
ncbi:MAG: ABC transporter permease [Candidatus Woesearchaeota archaeon]